MKKNNNVIKALSIGLSAAMLLQPMAALADEIEVVNPDNEDAKILVLENEEEKEEESYSDKLEAAEGLVDEAIKEEKEAHVEAVASVGSGVLSAEALAIIAESNAKKDVAKAEDIVEKAEEKIDEYLDDADKHTVSANDAIEAANNASVSANEAAKEAEAASVSANEAGTSGAAGEFVGVAKEQSGIADEKATEAEEKLEEANEELIAANAAYELAVEEANKAVEAANKAIADGAADAEAAVTAANIALERAEALKNATGEVLGTATGNLDKATADYNKANEDLAAATAALGSAVVKELQATATTVETGLALAGADVALVIAQGVKDIAEKNYESKEAYLKELMGAKDRAQKEIDDAKEALNKAKKSESISDKEYQDELAKLEKAQEALESVNASLETAKQAVTDAAEKEKAAQEAFDAVKESVETEGYEKTIYDLQKELVETKAKDSEANVDELVQKLTHAVAEHEFKKAETDTVKYTDGVYVVTTAEGTKYYMSEIADDGSIEFYEYTKNTEYEKVVDTVSGNEPAATENTKVELVKEATEALYTVTYTEKTGTETKTDKMLGSEFMSQYANNDALPEGAVVKVENVLTLRGYRTLYYKYGKNGWQAYYNKECTDKGTLNSMLDGDHVVLTYSQDKLTTVTKENVKESDLGQFTGNANYSSTVTTPAQAAEYKVYHTETSSITKAELDKILEEHPDDLITYESNNDGEEARWIIEPQAAEYSVSYTETVTDKGGIDGNIRTRLEQTIGGNDVNNKDLINSKVADGYDVTVTIDGKPYHIKSINLKDYNNGRAYIITSNNSRVELGNKNADVRVSWTKTTTETKTITNVSEEDLSQYSDSSKYTVKKTQDAVEGVWSDGKEETFTVTTYKYTVKEVTYSKTDEIKDGGQSSIYSDYNDKSQKLQEATSKKEAAKEKVKNYIDSANEAGEALEIANTAVINAEKSLEEKKQAVKDAQDKLDKLQNDYDEYFKGHWEGLKYDPSQYSKDLVKAEAEVLEAWGEYESAKLLLKQAQEAQKKAKETHEKALAAYNAAIKELAKATANELAASVKVAETGAKLAEMKTAYAVAKAADDYANGLKNSADEAYQAAVAARDALEALKNNASVKQDEIEKAEAAYKDAWDAYNKAKEEAENARAMADQAQKDYESALAAYNRLLAAEEAARNNGNDDSEVNEETIEVPVVVAPVRTATRRAVVTPAAEEEETAPEAVVEEVVIADEEVALAETPVEEEKVEEATVAIEDEDTPLATQEEKAMSWWWLLIVLVLGTTGAEMYRRHQLKKNAATVEADEK